MNLTTQPNKTLVPPSPFIQRTLPPQQQQTLKLPIAIDKTCCNAYSNLNETGHVTKLQRLKWHDLKKHIRHCALDITQRQLPVTTHKAPRGSHAQVIRRPGHQTSLCDPSPHTHTHLITPRKLTEPP